MRALLFTTGSPFSRAVRILLDELGLEYERREEVTTPMVEARAAATPTLQVPVFRDGEVTLWESDLIAEYLLTTYPERLSGNPPLAAALWRDGLEWQDKLLLATIQTLGNSITTISQMLWSGLPHTDNAHLTRCAVRLRYLMDWLEQRIDRKGEGFLPDVLSVQDVFLSCHLQYLEKRPLALDLDMSCYPKIGAMLARTSSRASLQNNPVLWWEPGVVGYESDGKPIFKR